MKGKKFDKRLVLNKKTIANIGYGELEKVQGGLKTGVSCGAPDPCIPTYYITCPTYLTCNETDCPFDPC